MNAVVADLSPEQVHLLSRLRFAQKTTDAFEGQKDAQHVYFFQQGTNGPIKIGASNDIGRRFRELQTGCAERLRILGVAILGGRSMERRLHAMFAPDRLEGEWFRPSEFLYEVASDYAGEIR